MSMTASGAGGYPHTRRHRLTVRLGGEVETIWEQDGMLTPSGRLGTSMKGFLEAWLEEPGRQITIEEVRRDEVG